MDYKKLAEEFGGVSVDEPKQQVDYNALAKEFGGVFVDQPTEKQKTAPAKASVAKSEPKQIAKLAAKMPQAAPEVAQDVDASMTDPETAMLQGAGMLPTPGAPAQQPTAATPADKPEEEQAPYGSLEEALDDAVNFIQEGASEKQVKDAFEAGGIEWAEIVAHAKTRGVYLSPTIVEYTPAQVEERVKKYGALKASPETQFTQEPTKYMTEALANVAKRAKATYKDVATSYLTQAGVIDPMDAAFLIKENARRKAAAAPSSDIQEGMANIAKAESYGDAVAEMAKNPRATFVMLVDSVAVSLPAMVPSLVMGPAGPLARMGAAFAGSGGLEYGTVLADALQDKGVDLSNAAAIESALRDPKFMEFVKEKGAKRGLAVGAFDAISMGLAGRFLKPSRTAIAEGKLSGAAAKRATMAGWGKELAVQAAGGAGGEFTAQQLTGENRPADVILEALGQTVTGPLEARSNLREARDIELARAKAKTPDFRQRIEPQLTTPGGAVPPVAPVTPSVTPAVPSAPVSVTPPAAPEISPVIPETDIEGVEEPEVTAPPATEEPAAAQPVTGFKTAKGSTYVVDEQGKTSRTKLSAGKGQGQTYAPHSVLYVSEEDSKNILEDRREGAFEEGSASVQLGYVSGNSFKPVADMSQMPADAEPKVAVINKNTNQVTSMYNAQRQPAVGLSPIEKLYQDDGTSNTHIGNPIVELFGQEPKKVAKPKAAKEPAPITEEVSPESEEAAAARKSVEDIQDQIKKLESKKGQNLFSVLRNKVDIKDVNDISPDNTFNLLRSKTGKPIADLVADGTLDDWLEFDNRSGSVNFDEQAATEYIKDKLRSGNYFTEETNNELRKLGEDFSRADAVYNQILELEDVNKELDAIANEEARLSQEYQAAAIAREEGVPARTEGQVPAEDFALTQETEADIRAREASLEDREQKAIADREREAFALQGQQQPLQPPPTGDMFGATGVTQQPDKKPSYVPTGPTAIEAAAQPVNVDQAVSQQLKKAGLDDLDTASENVQKERGVSKPVADALVRAYQKQMTVMVRSQYGQATEKEIKDTSAAVDKLEKRLEGMKKRKKTIEAKKEEAKPAAVAEPKKEAPAPMPGAKGKQPPILKAPEGFELKAGRNEQVALAAEKLANGEITRNEYDQYVDYYMPVFLVPSPEAPLNAEGMKRVLDKNQAQKVDPEIKDGTRVGLRMDLKALRRGKQIGQNGSVVSIHEGMPADSSRQGKIIGYGGAARAKNVNFAIRDQKRSFGVARNVEDKAPQQTIEGEWINDAPENIYAEAKRLMNDPAWSQVSLDPMRHSFFYDRKNMQPVISADEVLQVGRFVIAKNVKYAPREQFLYNIEVGDITPGQVNAFPEIAREDRIAEYARIRQRRAHLMSKVEKGGATLDIQRELTRLREIADNFKTDIEVTRERQDSAKAFLSKALSENVKGNLDDDVFDAIQWMYNNAPGLLDGLLLRVRKLPQNEKASGGFMPVARAILLFKGTRGTYNPSTIRHEITHSMEQMMNPGARQALVSSWRKAFQKEMETNKDPKVLEYLLAVMNFLQNPTTENQQKAAALLPEYKYYQLFGPSEYWAVNAEKLMKADMGPMWERFKKGIQKFVQYLKNLFGFDNTYVFHQVYDGIMRGDMTRFDKMALTDYVTGSGIQYTFLKNVEDTDNLHNKYDVPDTPLDASNTLKDRMLGAANNAKNAAKDAVNNPLGTAAQMVGSLDRGAIAIRNQNVWFGTGLDVADFKRYNGQLRDANGKVASSIAVTQAMHAGHVGTNVIRLGALEFNPDTQLFMAVENPMSMANVVVLKHELTKKLGAQRAANVINTYFIAKRARSIQNEYFDRSYAFENAAPGSSDKRETGIELDQVIKAYEKIPTFLRAKDADGEYLTTKITNSEGKEIEVYVPDDEAIDSFIAQENDYTQLAEMSKNWSAVNRNMLDNMYFAGILSKKRYETLVNIKDYVPWYRIMDDMTDVHEPTSGIVRGMASVPRERRFGKGGTDRDIDDVIDNMLHNVLMLTKNTMRNYAANRVAQEYATRNDQGKIKVYTKEGVDEAGVRTNILVGGRRIIVQIRDPLVAQAVIGMESFEIPSNKILAAMANLFRRTITLSPVFQVKQLFKDAPMAAWYSNLKNPFAVWGNVFSSFVSALNPNDPIVAKLKSYGIGGFQSIARSPERELKIEIGLLTNKTTDKVLSLLDRIGDASDFAQRRAIYKRVLKETGDETLALLQANNVIDFMKRGSAQHAQFLARNVAFMNAYAQSIDVLAQTLAGGGLKGKARSKAIATMAATGGLLASMTILYAIGASMDPEYEKLDDQTKMRNIFVPFSKQMFGQPILIPVGTSASFFFKAVPEMLYNYVITQGTETEVDKTRLKTALWESAKDSLLGPDPVPSGVRPFMEIALNRNFFTGRPLTPENLKSVEAAEQYTSSTSQLGKVISSGTSIPGTDKRLLNPIEADQIVRGLFGSAGALSMWGANMMSGERPDPTMKEMPVIGSFVGQPVSRGREDLFYDFKERVDKKYDTFQIKLGRLKGDDLTEYLDKNQDLIVFQGYTETMAKQLQEINSIIKMFSEGQMEGVTPAEKRKTITELQQAKQDMLEGIQQLRKEAGL